MKRIGLISDTHGFLDPKVYHHFEDVDEIWHAGDFGTMEVAQQLAEFKPLKGVYGNIDDKEIRYQFPKDLIVETEGFKVFITHIGGYPGHYAKGIKEELQKERPDLFICGHSHILRVISDPKLNLISINPGAAGNQGFHKIKTIMKFDLNNRKLENVKAIELGKRG